MIIISWDVGVIHLAYCVLEYNPELSPSGVKILDWNELNLVEDNRIKLVCCGQLKFSKEQRCGKNASYYLNSPEQLGNYIGFCKAHLKQSQQYWSREKTENLFQPITYETLSSRTKFLAGCASISRTCTYYNRQQKVCGKKCKYVFRHFDQKKYYCLAHYKAELKRKIAEFSPQKIKNSIVRKYPTSDLQLNLVHKLDRLAEHFAKLGVEEVIIENQPSMKNPKMKAIASTLFDYFMIRGYVDKVHHLDIQLVRYMCPSNKLKVNEDNTIEVFKANKNKNLKYKLTKTLSIQYTKQLLKGNKEQLAYLDIYKKQDDLCDAYLQGRYYLEILKHKK